MEIEIVTFVVKGSAKLTVPTDLQEQKLVNEQTLTPNNNANFEQSKDQEYENITNWAIFKFITEFFVYLFSIHKYF